MRKKQIIDIFASIIEQEKAALHFGFYWETLDQLLAQINSECMELKEAYLKNNQEHLKEEVGDLLHAIISLSIFLNQDPREVLKASIEKMQLRYDTMVDLVKKDGLQNLVHQPLDVLLSYWNKAKNILKQQTMTEKS